MKQTKKNVLLGVNLISESEGGAIAEFATKYRATPDVNALAVFLAKTFKIELATDLDIVSGFSSDESHLPGKAIGVCRPRNARDVSAILNTCFLCGVPVTVCAGRSNLTGSATPEGGIMLSMVSMKEPARFVDETAKQVKAPIGMILEEMRKAVLAETHSRLYYPVDPTSRAEATVGGSIACNASGFTPGASGATRDWVQRVGVILPCGTFVSASRGEVISEDGKFVLNCGSKTLEILVPRHPRPAIKNAGGPYSAEDGVMDFVDFIVGSEGLYGVVVDVTLKLLDRPEAYLDFFFSLPSEEEAVKLRIQLEDVLEGDLSGLTAFEYFGVNCRKYMKHESRFFSGENPVAVYLQIPVSVENSDNVTETWFERLCSLDVAIDPDAIILLDNERDRTLFMEARHSLPANSLEVVTHRGTYTLMTDTVVPKENFSEFLSFTHALLNENKLDYLAFGHLGDCHLHFSMMPEKSQLENATRVYERIVAKSAELGGVYSGEHGTGKRKRADFMACNGQRGVDEIRKVKSALDPEYLLNRGNVVTLP